MTRKLDPIMGFRGLESKSDNLFGFVLYTSFLVSVLCFVYQTKSKRFYMNMHVCSV